MSCSLQMVFSSCWWLFFLGKSLLGLRCRARLEKFVSHSNGMCDNLFSCSEALLILTEALTGELHSIMVEDGCVIRIQARVLCNV